MWSWLGESLTDWIAEVVAEAWCFVRGILAGSGAIAIAGVAFMVLWDGIVVPRLGVSELSFGAAVGIVVMARLVFQGPVIETVAPLTREEIEALRDTDGPHLRLVRDEPEG